MSKSQLFAGHHLCDSALMVPSAPKLKDPLVPGPQTGYRRFSYSISRWIIDSNRWVAGGEAFPPVVFCEPPSADPMTIECLVSSSGTILSFHRNSSMSPALELVRGFRDPNLGKMVVSPVSLS
jgi:hypothetical protein